MITTSSCLIRVVCCYGLHGMYCSERDLWHIVLMEDDLDTSADTSSDPGNLEQTNIAMDECPAIVRWFTSYKSLVIRSLKLFSTHDQRVCLPMNRCFFSIFFPILYSMIHQCLTLRIPMIKWRFFMHHEIPIRIPGPIFGASPQICRQV